MIVAWTRNEALPGLESASPEFRFEYARQKNLWQKLALTEEEIPALRYQRFYEIDTEKIARELPERLFVFAPTALPKTHFEMLKKLSAHTQILFYYHNLSDNFWIESRNKKRALANPQSTERGNELLTSWGKAARALAGALIENNWLGGIPNGDMPPERNSLLHQLQADIRENSVRESTTKPTEHPQAEPERLPLADDTVSLRVHAAHSRMREMEILRDDLRDLMARDSAIRPRDILVMLPDIDAYAPFIRAVFENSEFPFSLADNTGAERFGGISAFLSVLKIARGEVRLSEVLELFNASAVMRRAELSDDDVKLLRKMLVESNTRWGIDGISRCQKIFDESDTSSENSSLCDEIAYNNSWEFGLRRTALGVMLGDSPDESQTPVLAFGENRKILPAENLPENAAELLGKFFRIFELIKALSLHYSGSPKSIGEWCRFLKSDLADALLAFSEEDAEEATMLAEAVESVRRAAEIAGIQSEPVGLKTVVSMLENRSWESSRGSGMLRGKITFCRLQPLRNIPAKAIYIAGMNAGEFPRPTRRSALDLIAQWPRALEWDRSSRDEDCLLLLEAVLAAKSYLRFSYIGRNVKNNFVIHPCTPLSKLIDEVVETLLPANLPAESREAARAEALNQFFFEHSPQSPEGEKLLAEKNEDLPWRPPLTDAIRIPLSEGERENYSRLSTEQIGGFFAEPAKFVCENRLQFRTARNDNAVSDADPGEETIKPGKLLVEILASGLNRLTDSELSAQNEISGLMRERFTEHMRRACFAGNISPMTNIEDKAKAIFPEFNPRHKKLWAKMLPLKAPGGTKLEPFVQEQAFKLEAENFPLEVRVGIQCHTIEDRDGKTSFIKTFPKVYSTGWEFKISALVTAAFLKNLFPESDSGFIALHPDFVGREKDSVLAFRLNAIPKDLARELLLRFFEGLENPQPYFSRMPFPENDNPSAFLKAFSDAESDEYTKDFSRPYREFLFGSDFLQTCEDTIRGDVFEFSRKIAEFFPSEPKPKTGKRG